MLNDTMEMQAAKSREVRCFTRQMIWFLQQKRCKGNKRMEQKARVVGNDVVSHRHHRLWKLGGQKSGHTGGPESSNW